MDQVCGYVCEIVHVCVCVCVCVHHQVKLVYAPPLHPPSHPPPLLIHYYFVFFLFNTTGGIQILLFSRDACSYADNG